MQEPGRPMVSVFQFEPSLGDSSGLGTVARRLPSLLGAAVAFFVFVGVIAGEVL